MLDVAARVAFPHYDGNGMYLSTGNIGHRMRLEGTASIDLDDPLQSRYPEAQLVVRVRARAVYPNWAVDALAGNDPSRDPGERDVLGR